MTQIVPQQAPKGSSQKDGGTALGPEQSNDDPRICRTRTAVLEAVRALFDEGGWDAVTHVTVAERSGVGRSTLYRHWPEASMLLRDMITDGVEQIHIAGTGDLRTDLIGELEALRHRLENANCERDMVTIMERATVDSSFADLRMRLTEAFSAGLLLTLRRAIADGHLRADTDPVDARDQLVGPLMFRKLFARRPVTRKFVNSLVDDFLVSCGT